MPEFLVKLQTSLIEFWAKLEKGQRIRLGAGIVLGLALLIAFVVFVTRPQYEPLFQNISQTEIGNIVESLKANKIAYKVEGSTISVLKGKADEVRPNMYKEGVVTDASIPADNTTSNIMETEIEKKARLLKNRENAIVRGLMNVEGISKVSVTLNMPEDNGFVLKPEENQKSAAVMITMKSNAIPFDKKQVYGIVRFIANSSGVPAQNVSLVDQSGEELNSNTSDGFAGTNMDLQNGFKKDIEKSVYKLLEAPFGSENVRIIAAVDLNFSDEVQDTVEYIPDPDTKTGVVRSFNKIEKILADGSTGGVPGTSSNSTSATNSTTTYPEGTTAGDKYNETTNTVNYEINEIKKRIVKEKGNIENLSTTVLLNQSKLPKGYNEAALKSGVVQLVGYALKGYMTGKSYTDQQLNSLVKITIMPFDDSQTVALATEASKQKQSELIKLILSIASVLLGVGVFAFALFIFVRGRVPRLEEGLAMAGGAPLETISVTGQDGKVYQVPKRPDIDVPEIDADDHNALRKQLEKFVSNRPEAVAQLLKNWISDD